jgi:hypothetical protein
MLIRLTDTYQISADGAYNFILQRRAVRGPESKNPGEEYWVPVGYFPSLAGCLSRALDDYQIRSETVGLQALRDELQAFTKQTLHALKGFEKELNEHLGKQA